MEQIFIYLTLILSGLILGSFAGATVWRLRARQLKDDKRHGEKVDASEYQRLDKLNKSSIASDRSQCLYCDYKLRWYDMVPVISWITLRGKCRNCQKSIGIMEPLIELGVALFFVLSYAFWPFSMDSGLEAARFIIWLVAGVGLAILFAYDSKWFILPDKVNFIVIGLGAIYSTLIVVGASDKLTAIIGIVTSALILSGLYLILYFVSRGKWVGFGDIKLGLGLALLLADWRLAFLALFVANLVGTLAVLPGILSGKLKRNTHVPFGPLLITGLVIAQLSGSYIISMYFSSLL
ncbi:MAG TPA: prepilin peptidase [Candidatus Saccharibacteria bacterium]|nr:prepilin peptidase [Candidatus Saccharibacteria bacterium]HRQ97913.1 prepilin peptidase [Candidatus Saccharibacteria bacterium]